MTDLRAPVQLRQGVTLVPVDELPRPAQELLDAQEGDFALTHEGARSVSKLVDAYTATLLLHFRTPETIPRAVARFGLALGDDPDAILRDSVPHLRQLAMEGFLVNEGFEEPTGPAAIVGERIGDYVVTRLIQKLDDTAVVQARSHDGTFVAIKTANSPAGMDPGFTNEAAVLGRLDGVESVPRVVAHEVQERTAVDAGHTMLVTEWRTGLGVADVAAALRADDDTGGLGALAESVAAAYAQIHARGVLHGDVHPGNILVDRDGGVSLIDFGLATTIGEARPGRRGGVAFSIEPEWARAELDGEPAPPVTEAGEQYAVAALLYSLLTGEHPHGYILDRVRLLEAVVSEPPRSFEEVDGPVWPAGEAVLRRALSRAPEARHPSMAAFAQALRTARANPPVGPEPRRPAGIPGAADGAAARFVEDLLHELAPDGPLLERGIGSGPTATVAFGAAGAAYGLLQLAVGRRDAGLLSAADVWACEAERRVHDEWAFDHPSGHMNADDISPASLFHHRAGIHLVSALVAATRRDSHGVRQAASAYVQAASAPTQARDITLGRLGVTLGASHLLELPPGMLGDELRAELGDLGQRHLDGVWKELALPHRPFVSAWPNLGLAHGWAGLFLATARWSSVGGRSADALWDHLDAYRVHLLPTGRGSNISWNDESGAPQGSMPGWCNGAAGVVLALLAVAEACDDSADRARLVDDACSLGWHAGDAAPAGHDLCCGAAGRAYTLALLGRATNDSVWLDRARRIAAAALDHRRSADHDLHPRHSLVKGDLGLAVLIDELGRPDSLRFPLLQRRV